MQFFGKQRMWRHHDLKPSYDVVIVGAGVHGLAAAYYLGEQYGIRMIPVRLTGQDPELVYVGDEPEAPAAAADEAYTARITLRLPEAPDLNPGTAATDKSNAESPASQQGHGRDHQ